MLCNQTNDLVPKVEHEIPELDLYDVNDNFIKISPPPRIVKLKVKSITALEDCLKSETILFKVFAGTETTEDLEVMEESMSLYGTLIDDSISSQTLIIDSENTEIMNWNYSYA